MSSATEFNPTGDPRRWRGLPGVRYPEEIAADTALAKEAARRQARRPAHCPPGFIPVRTVCMRLHVSESRARLLLREHDIEHVEVRPMYGCPYHAYSEAEVNALRDAREERIRRQKKFLVE